MCVFAAMLADDAESVPDLSGVSSESDLYPLVSLLADSGSDLTLLLAGYEHMPTRYQSLMRKLK